MGLVAAMLGGCSPSLATWESPEPAGRVQRILKAVREDDKAAVPQLIRSLRSDDPLVRMVAGDALIRLTGEDFGYRYDQSETDRTAAMKRWESWLAGTRSAVNTSGASGATEPAAAAPSTVVGAERSNP
jgi:hypothetical protein